MLKGILFSTYITFSTMLAFPISARADDLHLKLESRGNVILIIQNIGDNPTVIQDIKVNNREECTRADRNFEMWIRAEDTCKNACVAKTCLKNFSDKDSASFSMCKDTCDRECRTRSHPFKDYTNDQLHKVWVNNNRYSALLEADSAPGIDTPVTIKVGDNAMWFLSCESNVVRVDVTTDQGTATYRFGG